MRKLTALVASATLLGGVLVASPAAWADDDDDFTLTGEFTDFDRDGDGRPDEGDEFSFEFDLYDDDGDDAGDGDGTCELTEVDRRDREFTADCEVVFDLDDGELEMEGEVTEEDFKDGKIVLDVVDGTDDYDDAKGEATFRSARGHHDHDRDHGRHHGHGRYEAAGDKDHDPDHDKGDRRRGGDRRDRDRDHKDHHDKHRDFKVHVELD